MKIVPGKLEGVCLIEPEIHADGRGFFMECWNARDLAANGIETSFVQHNHSHSQAGVLRGLHFQNPLPQAKLVWVTSGAIFDVVVDLRRSSPTFGHWSSYQLSARNRRQLWVPSGFAHGFLALEPDTGVAYACSEYYAPEHEHCLAWDDAALAIDWPLGGSEPIISDKDRRGLSLAESACFP